MKNLVIAKISELQKFSLEKWGLEVNVTINYDLDSAKSLGTYSPKSKTISLNEKLLYEYKELYIEDIVIHEFVHALVHTKYPTNRNGYKRVMPHGREFKAFCSWFGIDGKATTSLFNGSQTMKKVKKQNTITYKCNCQTHELSKIKHNKILKGKASYSCRTCACKLEAA